MLNLFPNSSPKLPSFKCVFMPKTSSLKSKSKLVKSTVPTFISSGDELGSCTGFSEAFGSTKALMM